MNFFNDDYAIERAEICLQEALRRNEFKNEFGLDNSFDVATSSGRTSIFRDQSGGVNSGNPIFYDKATQRDIHYVQMSGGVYVNLEPPYTTIYFDGGKQVCLTSFEIHMQAGVNWYIGLTEFAIDWIFADYFTNGGNLVDCCSYWYGKF